MVDEWKRGLNLHRDSKKIVGENRGEMGRSLVTTNRQDSNVAVNVLTFFPLTGGCSEGLDAFRFFLKHLSPQHYTVDPMLPP